VISSPVLELPPPCAVSAVTVVPRFETLDPT
jgi:hypothetical protein